MEFTIYLRKLRWVFVGIVYGSALEFGAKFGSSRGSCGKSVRSCGEISSFMLYAFVGDLYAVAVVVGFEIDVTDAGSGIDGFRCCGSVDTDGRVSWFSGFRSRAW